MNLPKPSITLAAALSTAALLAPAEARANVETLEVWTELGVRVVPVRRLRVTISNSVRFSTLYGLRRVIPELEVDYKVLGPLRIGGGYRYLWRRGAQGDVEQGHRLHADATLQLGVRRLDFELRSRVQWRTVGENHDGFLEPDERSMWRNRLNVEWSLPGPFTVNAFVEHWTRLDGDPRHDRFRVGGGLSVDVSRWRFHLYYQRDMPEFIDIPNVNMVGLSARLNLDLTRR